VPEPFQRLLTSTADLETPFAVVDEPALWANADDLVRRAAEVPIRVASKSVRVRSIIDRTLAREGFTGVMSYSLAESNWLVDNGIDDILLAYPTTSASALKELVADDRKRAAITVMVDSTQSLDHIADLLGARLVAQDRPCTPRRAPLSGALGRRRQCAGESD